VLDKYMGAAALIPRPTGYGSGFSRLHELSHHDVVGTTLLASLGQ
jgi:hypothetical protein